MQKKRDLRYTQYAYMTQKMIRDIDALRRLLAQPPTTDTANALKSWRERERLSQTEAAIRLGVAVRTLQGWELGRPMPYPSLLEKGMHIAARAQAPYSLMQSDFPRELAEFIDFVGASDLDVAVRKVDRKLGALSEPARLLFGDRYFFHEQCVRFADGPLPFQLDISDPVAIRAASFIGGVNRVRKSLSSQGAFRLRAMIKDNLMPHRDIRQIEHEIRCSTHFGQKGHKVTFADLEALGTFDLLVETPSASFEIECKTVTEETGAQIKTELTVSLAETFRKIMLEKTPVDESGVFTMTLKRPAADCKNLAHQLEAVLRSATARSSQSTDFSLDFLPRPQWQGLLDSDRLVDLKQQILLDCSEYARCAIKAAGKIMALVVCPHKPTVLGQRVVEAIKKGANQCTGDKQAVVWLHFVGLAEAQFLALVQFSNEGKGAGLNAIVANALRPNADRTDRSHVHSIRFSADGRAIDNHLAIAPNLLLGRAVTLGGMCYIVPNPYCRFSKTAELE
jgi:DNA-binding transcriptional regulator YiaG